MTFFYFFWFRCGLYFRRRRLLLYFFMYLLSKIACRLCGCCLRRFNHQALLFNLLKIFLDNWVRIEPHNGALDFSLRVEHRSEGKRVSLDLIADGRIPSTVEVIDLK